MFRVWDQKMDTITYQIRVHVEVQLKAAYIYNSIVQACEGLHLLQAEDRENKTLSIFELNFITITLKLKVVPVDL